MEDFLELDATLNLVRNVLPLDEDYSFRTTSIICTSVFSGSPSVCGRSFICTIASWIRNEFKPSED